MPGVGVIAVAGALAAIAALAPRRWAFGALVSALLLIPAPLVVPNAGSPFPTVGRVVLLAAAFGLLWRLVSGRLDPSVLRVTSVHLALGLYLLASLVLGVGAAAATTPVVDSAVGWAAVLEQAFLFVVVLAWIRALPSPWDAAWIVGGVAVVLVLVASVEHATGWSWGRWWFSDLPSQQATDAARPLNARAGERRVRASAEFALEFGWVAAALLPLLLALATQARRARFLVPAAAAVLCVLTVYWSVSRSPTAAVGAVALAVVVAVADRRVGLLAAGAGIAAVAAVIAIPGLLDPLSLGADVGAVAVRSQRLPEILGLAAMHPWTGLGFSGLDPFGFPTTDSSYLLAYAEVGVIGLSFFVGLLAVAVAQVARGVVVPRADRVLPFATLAGMLTLLLGAWFYDAFSVLLTARLFWVLAALGVVAAGAVRGPLPARPAWTSMRAAVPAGAVLGGLVVAFASTGPAVSTYRFETLTPLDESAPFDAVTFGERRIASTCTLLRIRSQRETNANLHCRDLIAGAGVGEIRVEGPSPQVVGALATDVEDRFGERLDWFEMMLREPIADELPTPWTTAPAWAGLVGLELALLAPGVLRGREDEG